MIVGVDYGTRRSGLALSDEFCQYALPLKTVHTRELVAELEKLMHSDPVRHVVFGLPLARDGSMTPMAQAVEDFSIELKHLSLNVFFQNEFKSTDQALALLKQGGIHGKRRKKARDEASAVIILQDFLDYTWPNLSLEAES